MRDTPDYDQERQRAREGGRLHAYRDSIFRVLRARFGEEASQSFIGWVEAETRHEIFKLWLSIAVLAPNMASFNEAVAP